MKKMITVLIPATVALAFSFALLGCTQHETARMTSPQTQSMHGATMNEMKTTPAKTEMSGSMDTMKAKTSMDTMKDKTEMKTMKDKASMETMKTKAPDKGMSGSMEDNSMSTQSK